MKLLTARTRAGLVLSGLVVLTACPMDVHVSVRNGSTMQNLTFVVSRGTRGGPTELPLFFVESCSAIFSGPSDEYWRIEASANPTPISELTFGQTPEGYTTKTAPRPLNPNACYAAVFGGAEEVYFATDASGQVSEISQEAAKGRIAK